MSCLWFTAFVCLLSFVILTGKNLIYGIKNCMTSLAVLIFGVKCATQHTGMQRMTPRNGRVNALAGGGSAGGGGGGQ